MNCMTCSHSFIGSNQVYLINFSFHQRFNDLVQMEFGLAETQKAAPIMVGSFYYLWVEINKFPVIVAIESISNSSYRNNLVDLLQHSSYLSNDGVHTRAYTTQTYNISSYLLRPEELRASWSCSHIFFLKLKRNARDKFSLFDDKLAWSNEGLLVEKRFLFLIFYFRCHQPVWIWLEFRQLQINNHVINSTHFT